MATAAQAAAAEAEATQATAETAAEDAEAAQAPDGDAVETPPKPPAARKKEQVALLRLLDSSDGHYIQPRTVLGLLTPDAPEDLVRLILEYQRDGDLVPVADLRASM